MAKLQRITPFGRRALHLDLPELPHPLHGSVMRTDFELHPPQSGVPENFFGQAPELGRWVLSEDLSQILGTGQPVEWLVFGAEVPERAAGALPLIALAPAARRFL